MISGPGIQPYLRFPPQQGVCFFLSLYPSPPPDPKQFVLSPSYSLFLPVSQINKIFKKQQLVNCLNKVK